MSKRLQVLMDDEEWSQIEAVAHDRGQTVSEWVRGVLREARREQAVGPVDKKLAAIRAAVLFEGPTADVQEMLRDIEAGYPTELPE